MGDKQELLGLGAKVLSFLPKKCPLKFRQAAEKIMEDLCSERVEDW